MDGPEAYGIGQDAARIAGGAAVAAGGYAYFTNANGWKFWLGVMTTFGGGAMFFPAAVRLIGLFTDEAMPAVASGIAGTMTLGVIYSLRKAAEKLNLAAWLERKAG